MSYEEEGRRLLGFAPRKKKRGGSKDYAVAGMLIAGLREAKSRAQREANRGRSGVPVEDVQTGRTVFIARPNPARKNPTKAQKRPNKLQRMIASTKRAKQNRVTAALKKFLHQANPAIETSGAMITKLKGGGFTIRPIKAVKRGRR